MLPANIEFLQHYACAELNHKGDTYWSRGIWYGNDCAVDNCPGDWFRGGGGLLSAWHNIQDRWCLYNNCMIESTVCALWKDTRMVWHHNRPTSSLFSAAKHSPCLNVALWQTNRPGHQPRDARIKIGAATVGTLGHQLWQTAYFGFHFCEALLSNQWILQSKSAVMGRARTENDTDQNKPLNKAALVAIQLGSKV